MADKEPLIMTQQTDDYGNIIGYTFNRELDLNDEKDVAMAREIGLPVDAMRQHVMEHHRQHMIHVRATRMAIILAFIVSIVSVAIAYYAVFIGGYYTVVLYIVTTYVVYRVLTAVIVKLLGWSRKHGH